MFSWYYSATLRGLEALLGRSTQWRPSYSPVQGRLLYVPESSLPYHISGYTTRTHAVIRALTAAGADVRVLTRPGYPWDRKDWLQQPSPLPDSIDDVVYRHAKSPSSFKPLLLYLVLAARVIARYARESRVACIHAASNHRNALPALLAAKRLGIPFYYEMRGLWEYSRLSYRPQLEGTAPFRFGLAYEGLVADKADKVHVISGQLARYARERWGIPERKMGLLPNCVDPDVIVPGQDSDVEKNTIGYAGSLVPYEGLDVLVDAVGILLRRGISVKVKVIGDGDMRQKLEEQVEGLGLGGAVSFLGRMAPDRARAELAKSSLVCLPRKPLRVCEMIPPIKLVEALAMAKPVIVSDLPVLRDELGPEQCGRVFKAGDPVALSKEIALMLEKTGEMRELGRRAREYVLSHRTWSIYADGIVKNTAPAARGSG